MRGYKYIKFVSDNRQFTFERLGVQSFAITVYVRPTGERLRRIYHKTDDVFVAGAKVFTTLLQLAHKLRNMGFVRI